MILDGKWCKFCRIAKLVVVGEKWIEEDDLWGNSPFDAVVAKFGCSCLFHLILTSQSSSMSGDVRSNFAIGCQLEEVFYI